MRRWIIENHKMSRNQVSMIVKDREALHAAVHGVAKSWTQLSDWTTKYVKVWKDPGVDNFAVY